MSACKKRVLECMKASTNDPSVKKQDALDE